MKRYLLLALVLILGLALGASEVILPAYYAEEVEQGIRQQVESVEELSVQISSRPAFLLLMGRIQKGSVSAREVRLRGEDLADLHIQRIEAVYKDLLISNTPEGAKVVAGENTYFQAIFYEDDLNSYLRRRFSSFDQIKLNLNDDLAILGVQVDLFNTQVSLQVSGNFHLVGQIIRFLPKEIKLENVKIPGILLNQVTQQIEFDLDLDELPLPLDLRKIQIEKGRLLVLGGSQLDQIQSRVMEQK